ncbi:MAG: SURF1 family protein [Rubrivivax sp.]|nr:SURF1 family protein [Rubrivivax sp.]
MALSRRSLVVLVAAVATAALTARAGLWQLDRAAQKNRLQAALTAQRALPALAVQDLAADAAAAAAQLQRSVVLEGRWLAAQTVYLDNRTMNGRAGFFAVTPLWLGDGSAVLVQRGWLPRDPVDRTRIVAPPPPEGPVRLLGRIAPEPSRLYEFAAAASGPIRQNLDLQGFALETGLRLRPLTVVQEDGAGAAQDGLLRQWPAPAADVHKHYGYAFQWFAMSALVIGLYVWFQLIRPRRSRHA